MNNTQITFSKKPIPLPAEYRPLYKIAQILLVLKISCRSSKGSLLKLHLFSWAMKSENNMQVTLNFVQEKGKQDFKIWSMEPSLNRALHYATAQGFYQQKNGKYELTETGESFINSIEDLDQVFKNEKLFLQQIGKSMSESKINALAKEWSS